MYKYLIVIIVLFSISCGKPKITITRNYVYNSEWEKGEYTGLKFYRIVLLDSTISIYRKDFHITDLRKYKMDSTDCYYERSVDSYHGKIFFDREDKSTVWSSCKDTSKFKKLPHSLKLNNWYLFQYIRDTWEYYVYVDKEGETHVYGFNPVNF